MRRQAEMCICTTPFRSSSCVLLYLFLSPLCVVLSLSLSLSLSLCVCECVCVRVCVLLSFIVQVCINLQETCRALQGFTLVQCKNKFLYFTSSANPVTAAWPSWPSSCPGFEALYCTVVHKKVPLYFWTITSVLLDEFRHFLYQWKQE